MRTRHVSLRAKLVLLAVGAVGGVVATVVTGCVAAAPAGPLMVVGAAAALAIAGLTWWTATSVVGPFQHLYASLNQGSRQLAFAGDQIASSSQSLANGTNRSAAALQETSASMEEMSSIVRHTADNARSAANLAEESRGGSERGAAAMAELSAAITAIKANADKCAGIIKTIDEIAFQTNLLALNAAVEAARAGDAGRGFAVVAEEVRNLAQRAGGAARETAELIESSITSAEAGVTLAGNVSALVAGLATSARMANSVVGEIAQSTTEILQGIEQVSRAVRDMDSITSANAAHAEEGASVGEELSAQAKSLQDQIDELARLFSGAGIAHGAMAAQPTVTLGAGAPSHPTMATRSQLSPPGGGFAPGATAGTAAHLPPQPQPGTHQSGTHHAGAHHAGVQSAHPADGHPPGDDDQVLRRF
jgi:hypothetical protein